MELERGTSVDGAQKSDEVWMELKKKSDEVGCGSKEQRGWVRLETSDGDEGGWRSNE